MRVPKHIETINDVLELSPASRDLLVGGVRRHRFARSAPVIHKGQTVSGAYLVTRGKLRVYTITPQANEATLYFLRPGETCVLAINCLFGNLRYPAWVEAVDASEVVVIPGPLYRTLFEREPSVQAMTVSALSTVVFRLMGEVEQLHSCKLDQRLARFLLLNAPADGIVRMTQQQLASNLGTTREGVARVMQGFVARGLVKTRRGAVELCDPVKLAAFVKSEH